MPFNIFPEALEKRDFSVFHFYLFLCVCGGWLGSPAKETWTIFLLPCKTTFLKGPHSPFNYHWNGVKWRISICTNFLIFILHLGISLWSHYTHPPTHLRTGLLGTLWAWGWVVFIRLFVAYLGRHPRSQEMQTSLEMMAVLSKSQRKKKGKQKWRWPVISLTGLVPTTGTFVDVDLPGNKCLEWNWWLILVLGRQSDMLLDPLG